MSCQKFKTTRGSLSRAALRFALAVAVIFAIQALRPLNAEVVLVLGDSLSAGYGIALKDGWVSLLAKRLGGAHEVVNASISGDTTAGGVQRIGPVLARHRPDVVIVELGGNDGLRGLSLGELERNLGLIVERSLAAGARVVLVGNHIPPNLGPVYAKRYHRLHFDVAKRYDLALVPFLLDGVATETDLMQGDGIHPKAEGQPRMLENVWRVLAPLLTNP